MKLAIVALLVGVGVGAGACVADEPSTSSRVDPARESVQTNVVDEIELQTYTDNIDFAVVTITGVEIPGKVPTQPNIDITNVDLADLDPSARTLCAQADSLPTLDVCSSLCDPAAFAARLFEHGNPGGCMQTQCALPGDVVVNLDVCTPVN